MPYTAVMSENLQQLAHGLVKAWNSHDPEQVAAFYAPECEEIDVAQPMPQIGAEGIRRRMVLYLRAFPNLSVTLDDVVVDGNRVAMAWTWCGTHRGTFMRIPPTGRHVTVRGTSFLTVQNGQIQKGTRVWDLAGLLRGLGLLPEL